LLASRDEAEGGPTSATKDKATETSDDIHREGVVTLNLATNARQREPLKIVNKPDNPDTDQGQATNAASIAAILLRGDGHVSHYMAGDMLWAEEQLIITWLGQKDSGRNGVRH
jgi:hypothetical protein